MHTVAVPLWDQRTTLKPLVYYGQYGSLSLSPLTFTSRGRRPAVSFNYLIFPQYFTAQKTAYFTFISSAAATLLLELADGPDTLSLVIFIHYFLFFFFFFFF